MAATPEGDVVQALIRECEARGWKQRKITYEGRVGAPDRMALAPSTLFFVECKAPGQVPASMQAREHERLRRAGVAVYVCDSEESVRYVFRHVDTQINKASFKPKVALHKREVG